VFDVKKHTILFTIAGSRSYGIHTPESDVDVKGICIPPVVDYKLGILNSFEQADAREHLKPFFELLNKEEQEATIADCKEKNSPHIAPEGAVYDLAKFFKLALNANPNILEVLYCDPKDIRLITSAGSLIRKNRDIFLSKKVVWSYQGYSFAQMKRIKSHRAWLLNPMKKEPTREEFGLPPDRKLISGDEQNAFLWVLAEVLRDKVAEFRLTENTRAELQDKVDVFGAIQSSVPDTAWPKIQEITGATTQFIQVMQAERKYKTAMSQWKSYQNWKKIRNPKRAALEKKCGLDSKHAAHLTRLMYQGREILEKGTLTVRLPEEQQKEILRIREGNITFDELEGWFEAEQQKMKEAVDKSSLPKKPNRKKADELLKRLYKEAIKNK
jgi:predicted nucleotidyltransferase